MESSDDWSYLQVHLWRSTSRKMTYPKSVRFFLLFNTFRSGVSVSRCARTPLLTKKISVLGGGTKLERNRMTMKTKRWMNDEQMWTVLESRYNICDNNELECNIFFPDSSLWCQGQERHHEKSFSDEEEEEVNDSKERGTLVSDGKAEIRKYFGTYYDKSNHCLILFLASVSLLRLKRTAMSTNTLKIEEIK